MRARVSSDAPGTAVERLGDRRDGDIGKGGDLGKGRPGGRFPRCQLGGHAPSLRRPAGSTGATAVTVATVPFC